MVAIVELTRSSVRVTVEREEAMAEVEIAAVKVVRETEVEMAVKRTLLALLVTNLTAVVTTTGTIEAM